MNRCFQSEKKRRRRYNHYTNKNCKTRRRKHFEEEKPSNESQFESMWKIKCKLIYLYAIDLSKHPN